jgi:hypothetical protein
METREETNTEALLHIVPAAHDVERGKCSMNANVANLHQKCGRRVFVPPAGFVFQRQSVAKIMVG